MNRWLDNFAYRVNEGIWEFFLGTALALLISLATVSIQAFRSAVANPIEVLRYD